MDRRIMEIPNKDYFEYKRGMGKWTPDQELMWDYLSTIVDLLTKLNEKDGFTKVEDSLKTGLPPLGSGGRGVSVNNSWVRKQ